MKKWGEYPGQAGEIREQPLSETAILLVNPDLVAKHIAQIYFRSRAADRIR